LAAAPGSDSGDVYPAWISECGYWGSHMILRDFMGRAQTTRCVVKPAVRIETPPGRQTQVDWAKYRVDGFR
jgi:transposase